MANKTNLEFSFQTYPKNSGWQWSAIAREGKLLEDKIARLLHILGRSESIPTLISDQRQLLKKLEAEVAALPVREDDGNAEALRRHLKGGK